MYNRCDKLYVSLIFIVCVSFASTLQADRDYERWKKKSVEFLQVGFHGIFYDALLGEASYSHHNVSEKCKSALEELKNGIQSKKLWALKMLDATGKSSSSVLMGTTATLGDYDQCLSIKSDTKIPFTGAYCLSKLQNQIDTPATKWFGAENESDSDLLENRLGRLPFTYGACLPSICSPHEVKSILHHYVQPCFWEISSEPLCSTTETRKFHFSRLSVWQKVSFVWLLIVVGSVLFATLTDITGLCKASVVDALSIKQNWTRLWAKEIQSNPRVFRVDFLRLVFLVGEIIAHSVNNVSMLDSFFLKGKTDNVAEQLRGIFILPLSGTTAQSTMFVLSGITCSLSAIRLLNSKNVVKSGILQVIYRWLKLVPIIGVAIALQMLMPFVASGPAYDYTMINKVAHCSKNGWQTFAMIDNWGNPLEMCIPVLWSISVDFQLYILLTIAVIILSINKTAGLIFAGLLVILGNLIPTYYVYAYNLWPTGVVPLTFKGTYQTFCLTHFSTVAHLSLFFAPFLILYWRSKGGKFPIDKKYESRFYVIFQILAYVSTHINAPWAVYGLKPSKHTWTIVEFFRRPMFIFFTSCMYISNEEIEPLLPSTSKDSNIKLQLKRSHFWTVVGRLIGPIFMSHHFFIILDLITSRSILPGDPHGVFTRCLQALFGSFVSGVIFYLLISAPFENIIKRPKHIVKKSESKSD